MGRKEQGLIMMHKAEKTLVGLALLLLLVFFPTMVLAAEIAVPHKKGRFAAVFERYSPHSNTNSIMKRMRLHVKPGQINGHHYDIRSESFEVYVPDTYDPNTPFGLMVWASPSPEGRIEHLRGARELMDKYGLIWVGANQVGNEKDPYTRRIPLALDAAYNMQRLYTIDPTRVYIAGLSGGGRISSIASMHYSDVFDGGIFIIGANYWEMMRVPGKGTTWQANMTVPRPKCLWQARESGRYVLLTGDNDDNRLQMHTYYERGFKHQLKHVLYMQVPGMGHEPPPPEEFEKAIIYIDSRETKKEETK